MLRCQFLYHVLKALFFIEIARKLSYFCKKMQNFRALGAPLPDPLPPAAGRFASRPPLAFGSWGLRPQTPKTAPSIANFWLCACAYYTAGITISTVKTDMLHVSRNINQRLLLLNGAPHETSI